MKYSININQKAVVELGYDIDLVDCALLDYLFVKCRSLSPKLIRDQKGQTWIDLGKLASDMPLLRIKDKDALGRRLKKLKEQGFLTTEVKKLENVTNRRLYVGVTFKTESLYITPDDLDDEKVTTGKSAQVPTDEPTHVPTQKSDNNTINKSSTNGEREEDTPLETLDDYLIAQKTEIEIKTVQKVEISTEKDETVLFFETLQEELNKFNLNNIALESLIRDFTETKRKEPSFNSTALRECIQWMNQNRPHWRVKYTKLCISDFMRQYQPENTNTQNNQINEAIIQKVQKIKLTYGDNLLDEITNKYGNTEFLFNQRINEIKQEIAYYNQHNPSEAYMPTGIF